MSERDPPKSPTLIPPRKSVELEDAGAHDLDTSEDEVFADANETILSPTRVPTTRVEKVDDEPSHGQVPGTAAYEMRSQDAVPDEVTLMPEGTPSRPTSRQEGHTASPGGSPIPRTVVERVDDKPSHGEVPGTDAHSKRLADAVPDSVVKAQEEAMNATSSTTGAASPGSPIPKMVITKVDSKPSHGEMPERGRSESSYFNPVGPSRPGASPIAADGGFGPMDYEGDSDEENTSGKATRDESTARVEPQDDTNENTSDDNLGDDFGDDFDDFEEGAEGDEDDFGDFGDGFTQEEPELEVQQPARPIVAAAVPSFPVLDFSDAQSLSDIISSTEEQLSHLFPATTSQVSSLPQLPDSSSTFLTDRSLSLWSQLVAPPPLQPRNWVRSRIRRLFLVSLGVPVDLDEILPKSKQKKLVLNYTSTTSDSQPQGAAARLRNDADNGSDSAASNPSGTKSSSKKPSRRKGPTPPPNFDIDTVKQLCSTTSEALEGYTLEELHAHIKTLKDLTGRGKEVLQYWVKQKEAAVGEKEAFDGVIENLVRHARKVRK